MIAAPSYLWVRPAIDEPDARLVPLEPLVEFVGVPGSVVELAVRLAHARELADYLAGTTRTLSPLSAIRFAVRVSLRLSDRSPFRRSSDR